ncbi:MAG: type II secretion system major pseudopilin GspG [Proteobacteria bacterium]|nr:type II secretion system major pseudopilin GspG [Pseudomonadota bacterium]
MMPMPVRRARSLPLAQRGFSLLEIMIVIVLIGVIVGLIGARIFGASDQAKYHLAQTQVDTIASKIEQYQSDTGNLPPNLEALVTAPGGVNGWLGPYAKEKDLKDPWNNPLVYKVPGESGPYDLISYGRDGKPGGDGVDQDIHHQ